MARFVVKAGLDEAQVGPLSFHEKTMYHGKKIAVGDEVFVFSSENQGGCGLHARGIVTAVTPGPGIRVSVEVRPTAVVARSLGRADLKPFRDLHSPDPRSEIDRKLYRQATNKIAGITDEAAAFLATFF